MTSKKRQKEEEIRVLKAKSLVRPTATETHFKVCANNMRDSVLRHCSSLCTNEYMATPRPLMHQACMHGCSASFISAAVIACQNFGEEEEALRKNSMEGYNVCSRYQHSDPRPHVFTTCQKYHREGIKYGRNKAVDFLNGLLDAELLSQQHEFRSKYGEVWGKTEVDWFYLALYE